MRLTAQHKSRSHEPNQTKIVAEVQRCGTCVCRAGNLNDHESEC